MTYEILSDNPQTNSAFSNQRKPIFQGIVYTDRHLFVLYRAPRLHAPEAIFSTNQIFLETGRTEK